MTFFMTLGESPQAEQVSLLVRALAGPDGARQFKSTKTADRKLAVEHAVEREALATAGKQATLVAAQARKVVAENAEPASGQALQFKTAPEF
jgi:hypothetical protein